MISSYSDCLECIISNLENIVLWEDEIGKELPKNRTADPTKAITLPSGFMRNWTEVLAEVPMQ